MQLVVLYLSTAIVFLGLDALMLRNVIKPVFEEHIGSSLAESLRIGPAAVFYLFYVGGVCWFVSLPALRDGNPGHAFLNGAILGALAYGTYEFTNYATLRDWTLRMVALDLTWGTILTGLSAWAGVMIAARFT
ncbi:hypothetical protein ATO6_08610 [Oceanicola sp. 22II-s10i]|uniref:DUF2177 family protein n=1 Tax=Oceanicola sp. 22II-s10i TaxID=1317116 RepID=UPI000B525CBD|nr:DUF2177 family protein [Oceanicola sp. 22II-s10i]OWU85098.1 hypothetical protein ATO6_08610 [Oceanicola sp. 22II-s10i]